MKSSALRTLLLASGSLIYNSAPAMAATYNFFFNNTEQGPGSTASPQLNIQGAGASGSPAVGALPPAPAPSPAPLPVVNEDPLPASSETQTFTQTLQGVPPAAVLPSQQTVPVTPAPVPQVAPPAPTLETSPTPASARRKWWPDRDVVKIAVTGGIVRPKDLVYERTWSEDSGDAQQIDTFVRTRDAASLGGELSFLPSRYISLNGWAGLIGGEYDSVELYWGGDMRLIPLRVGLFGIDDFLELSAGVGVTSLAAQGDLDVSGYAVASASFGLGMRDAFLVATVKGNMGFAMAEAGVGYRF